MDNRNRNWEGGGSREAEWNRERERWASQGNRPDWSQFGGDWYPGMQGGPESGDWREGFRGGFGNSGQMSRAAYNRGGVGAGYDGPGSWGGAGRNEFGPRGGWGFEGRGYPAESYSSNFGPGYSHPAGHPQGGYSERFGGPANEGSNFGGRSYEGNWSERAYGPRDQGGGFRGHEYDWTTRGERSANQQEGVGFGEGGHSNEGPYTGKGPQGYQRSDERVFEEVCDRLTEAGQLDASNIRVQIESGEITLEGTVTDRRSKRLAEEIAESARGVRDVHNRLRVAHSDRGGEERTTSRE